MEHAKNIRVLREMQMRKIFVIALATTSIFGASSAWAAAKSWCPPGKKISITGQISGVLADWRIILEPDTSRPCRVADVIASDAKVRGGHPTNTNVKIPANCKEGGTIQASGQTETALGPIVNLNAASISCSGG